MNQGFSKPTYVIVILAWGLWLGGLVALLLFVARLFQVSRPVAVEAAPVLFVAFASYQIMVGLIACAAGTFLAVLSRRTVHAVMTLLMLLALTGAMLNRSWTYEMEQMRAAGKSGEPEFSAMHAKTSVAYTSEAALLTIAGIGFILTSPTRRTGQGIAQGRAFQASPADQSAAPPAPAGHAQPR